MSASAQVPAGAGARPRRRPARGRPRRRRPPGRRRVAARRSSIRASTGNAGGSKPERRRVGGERVAVLRPADRALGVGDDLEQADLAHALEVGAHGVGCRPSVSAISAVASGRGRAGQLEVDRVAGVVAERLQQLEPRRLDLGSLGHAPWSLHGSRPVESGSCPPPRSPPRTTCMARAPRRDRPRARQRHRRARHGQGRPGRARRRRRRHHRPHHRRLPAAGPDPARRPRPGRLAARASPTSRSTGPR